MINHATRLTDKVEQQKCVDAIIAFMGQMNPHLRDVKEFTHKLWDHLHIMSDFKLDIKYFSEKFNHTVEEEVFTIQLDVAN